MTQKTRFSNALKLGNWPEEQLLHEKHFEQYYSIPDRMDQKNVFSKAVKLGNWPEEQLRQEDKEKVFLEKREKGELIFQKVDYLKREIFSPVKLSATNDGQLHFGDVVMLVNADGENREYTAVNVNADIDDVMKSPSPGIRSPCGVSAGRETQPCKRNAFIITSVDGSPEGSTLLYDQSFALTTTSGFTRGLFLTSDVQSFQKCAKMSRLQEVNLVDKGSFLSWWKIVHFDPQERLEHMGFPVPADEKVIIVHCKTNHALAFLGNHPLWTRFGQEYEVVAHTFLNSHKAEEDKNQWMLCTSDPESKHPESACDKEKLTQEMDGI